MATQMFNWYDNLPEDYIPNNRPFVADVDSTDSIIIGGTAEHKFVLHFSYSSLCKGFEIVYKQSIGDPILVFASNDNNVDNNVDVDEQTTLFGNTITTITVHLSVEQTKLFNSFRTTQAQLRLDMLNGDVIYGNKNDIKIITPLDVVDTEVQDEGH